MTDAVVLRQRVAPATERAVRELVADELSGRREVGTDGLLRTDDVHTASLFLGHADEAAPELVWYVEVEDASAPPWTDPVTTLVRDAPLFDAELGDLLETPDSARVFSDVSTAADVLVHAWLPGRPTAVERGTDGLPVLLSPGTDEARPDPERPTSDPTAPTSDVVLYRLKVKPGFATRFVRFLAGVTKRLDDEGWIERAFDELTEPVLEDEGMWTETVYLERTDGDHYLLWYMEAEDMDEAYEAYFETANPVARFSEYVIGRILANPRRGLSNPVESSDYELLAHAVSPGRP